MTIENGKILADFPEPRAPEISMTSCLLDLPTSSSKMGTPVLTQASCVKVSMALMPGALTTSVTTLKHSRKSLRDIVPLGKLWYTSRGVPENRRSVSVLIPHCPSASARSFGSREMLVRRILNICINGVVVTWVVATVTVLLRPAGGSIPP